MPHIRYFVPTKERAVRKIGFLVFDGFQSLDVTGPADVFSVADATARRLSRQHSSEKKCQLSYFSLDGKSVVASNGMTVSVDGSLVSPEVDLDVLILSGGDIASLEKVEKSKALAAKLWVLHKAGTFIVSICNGTFLLAPSGLLDGLLVTTHWQAALRLEARYPALTVDPDKLFSVTEHIATSAGVASGIDLALDFVARWYGDEIAFSVAKELVVPYRRSGSQRQLSMLLAAQASGPKVAALLAWIRQNLRRDLSVEELADHMAMSRRSFYRWFKAETGLSPAFMVSQIRMETATALLEQGGKSVKEVARFCGFSSADHMAVCFRRHSGISPSHLLPDG
ncbi:transcriptional regulator, AraC family with amidase-like domain [Kordiimonas lacus]|uniref:Transcriptional regulator, AraC family with amidase-like domain n=1 Tax=Kordiimonas lacus TaxID=637679 RepID=A0A1G7D542_9PROT|nr:transcriptional regulator, AraC family with amidase-like domain [Kordiimonas lacus]